MNKQTIIESIKAEKPYLQEHFGGEENADSDLDILVSIKKPSYSLLMGLYAYLEKKLNTKIDLTRKGPHVSERFLKYIGSFGPLRLRSRFTAIKRSSNELH